MTIMSNNYYRDRAVKPFRLHASGDLQCGNIIVITGEFKMRCPDVEKAMQNKYGQRLKEWNMSKGYHKKLQDGDTGMMVWYHTDGGITGRQWLETIYAWEDGNTVYMFDPDRR